MNRTSIRVALGLPLVAVVAVLATASGAAAQETPGNAPAGQTFTLSAAMVNVLLGAVLPFLVGALLKESNPRWLKATVGLLVAAVAAVLAESIRDDGTAILSWDMLANIVTVYVAQVVAYLGLWGPAGDASPKGSFNRTLGPGVVPGDAKPKAA